MVFQLRSVGSPRLVDKPRRRKQSKTPWGKIAAAVLVAVVLVAVGWYVYWTYVYSPPPVYVRVDTTLGSFEAILYPACAPKTVNNIVTLAKSGFYDNLTWHRIVKGFVIQTGDPNTKYTTFAQWNSSRSTWGQGGSPTRVPLELCGWLHNSEGYLGMARAQDPGSGSSQFYVNLSNSSSNLSLDSLNYTVFGKVITGMDVVLAIGNSPVYTSFGAPQPRTPVLVKDIVVLGNSP